MSGIRKNIAAKNSVTFAVLILIVIALAAGCAPAGPATTPTAAPPPVSSPTTSPSAPTAKPTATPTQAPTTAAKQVTFKGLTPWTRALIVTDVFYNWVNYVNDIGKDQIRINILGGPEVIPALDQFEAMRSGIVDVLQSAGGYHYGIVPESQFLSLTPWPSPTFTDTAKRERAAGFVTLMTDVYEKYGARYLGRSHVFSPVELFTKKPVNKISDLKGKRIRSQARYNDALQTFGAVPITMMEPEIYTALERGTIDGLVHLLSAVFNFGWIDFTKYNTPEPFFELDTVLLMDLDKWNSLSDSVKKLISDSVVYSEEEFGTKYYQRVLDEKTKELVKAGVQFIPLAKEESSFFQNTLVSGALKTLKEKAKPELLARYQQIAEKAKQ